MTVTPAHPSTTPDLTSLAAHLDPTNPHQALASAHAMTQELARWQHALTTRRDDTVVALWFDGNTRAQIAATLDEDTATVTAILADYHAAASWEQRQAYALRAAQEYAVTAVTEPGNLFAAQDAAA